MGCEPVSPIHNDRYRKSLKSSTRRRAKSEWIPLILPDHLKIIARDQWQRVQAQLDRNLAFSTRNAKHAYLLRGLVRCGGCGATYVGDPNHGAFYYRCYRRCKRFPTIRESLLDAAVWGAVEGVILKPNTIKEQLGMRYDQQRTSAAKTQTEAKEIEHTLEQVQVEEDRILEAYRKGVLSAALLGRELEQINQRRSFLQARKLSVGNQAETIPLPDVQKSVAGYCKAIAKKLRHFTEQERQRFLRFIVKEVTFEGNRVRITGALPVMLTSDENTGADDDGHMEKNAAAIGGIAPTTSRNYARNPVFSDHRIAPTTAYRRAHNSVAEVPFEVSQNLPEQPLPLRQQIRDDYLRKLIERDPRCTLKQLCDWVREERGVAMSKTAMCRLVKGYNLQRQRSHGPHIYPSRSLALAA